MAMVRVMVREVTEMLLVAMLPLVEEESDDGGGGGGDRCRGSGDAGHVAAQSAAVAVVRLCPQ